GGSPTDELVDPMSMPEVKWAGEDRVQLRADASPLLFVVVDTEEEFDWNAPFSRANTSVRAMDHIDRLQQLFSTRGIVPTYVVDFPVASQPRGFGSLKQFADEGRARIGAHLHPWVNPPFAEEVSGRNSFGCNLGAALETEKIRALQAQIAESFGRTPRVYKAGRYGFAGTTASALETLGFSVDVSVNPRMNFSTEGGPSFDDFDTTPFFFGERRRLLEVPCSTDYTGMAGSFAPWLHRAISHPSLAPTRIVGVMSRLRIVNKIMLSPEGSSLDEMRAVTASLLRRGLRTFSLTMHSPSVEPGCTPYVRSQAELGPFLDRVAAYCDYFLGEVGGVSSTPEDFFNSLERNSLQERLA
ncbi:MAG: polysaccharide deacetylase family protein, partial [Vicinamibacterales bacterium]